MTRERILTVQRTIYLSPEVSEYLSQLARRRGPDCNESQIIREAIRAYLDQQSDVIGSRRHFQKSFQERIDGLENTLAREIQTSTQRILFYLQILLQLVAFSMAHVITTSSRKEISAAQLLQKAIVDARREESVLDAQIESARDSRNTP